MARFFRYWSRTQTTPISKVAKIDTTHNKKDHNRINRLKVNVLPQHYFLNMDDSLSFLHLVSYKNIMVSFCRPCVCLDKPFRNYRDMCLMQDGAISHTAYTTLNLLQAHRNRVLPWPSKSPDLKQLSIFGMTSIGWLGDEALSM